MPVADGGGDHPDARLTHGLMQAEIGHHRTDHRIAGELAFFLQRQGAQGQDAIARDGGPAGVGENHAVRIAVERDADIGALLFHDFAGEFRVERPYARVDIDAVRVDTELHDLGTQFLEDERGEKIAGTMSAIDDDLHAVEMRITQALLHELNVTSAGVVDTVGLADLVSGHAVRLHVIKDFLFDERFQVVRKLETIRPEDLQAVVFIRIMRSCEHDARTAAHRLGQMRHCRGRHRTD